MTHTNANPAGLGDGGARKTAFSGENKSSENSQIAPLKQDTVRAELVGSNWCTLGEIVATGNAPVLVLCRQLIAAGVHPDSAMEIFRGAVLALTVRSIGEAAQLEVNGKGTGFVRRRADVRTGPPMRKSDPALTGGWTDWPASAEAGP